MAMVLVANSRRSVKTNNNASQQQNKQTKCLISLRKDSKDCSEKCTGDLGGKEA
jgi:hypothetical protein